MKDYNQFHDGYLEGLWIDGTTVHVYLCTLEKQGFTAVAQGVVALAATGFRAGNLIFEVLLHSPEEVALCDIAEVYNLPNGSAGELQTKRELEKARQEGLTLLEINPSYGASCLILAHSVELLGRNEWLSRYLMRASRAG
jgi:hypothetical protein